MNGKLIIVCAPSGAGKTTIVRHILENIPSIEFSVSATNRKQRPNEINGHDYYFIETDDFTTKIAQGEFLEWEEVYPGTFYGTLKEEIHRIWNRGNNVIFDVDVIGGLNIRKILGSNCVALFIRPPDLDALRTRLLNRKSETLESMKTRLEKATYEMQFESSFDASVINAELEQAVKESYEHVHFFLENEV